MTRQQSGAGHHCGETFNCFLHLGSSESPTLPIPQNLCLNMNVTSGDGDKVRGHASDVSHDSLFCLLINISKTSLGEKQLYDYLMVMSNHTLISVDSLSSFYQ